MKRTGLIGLMLMLLLGCGKDDYYSPDINDPSLLPDRGDYLNEDYGTVRWQRDGRSIQQ